MTIRRVRPDDGVRLKEVAIAAKSHWGDERERVLRWADDGDFSPRRRGVDAFVADVDGRAVGWASLLRKRDGWRLEDLWVEPAWMGRGLGARLFRHAAAYARALGAEQLQWEADPNAVAFYERMGARVVRDSEPSVWGRDPSRDGARPWRLRPELG